jgi:hypothetical protein
MFDRFAGLRSLVLLAGASILSTMTWANGLEVSGFGGGITADQGGGTHPLVGGAAAYALGDNFHLFGEFSYSPLASASFSATNSSGVTASGSESAKLANFGGGLDYTFLSPHSKLRPYVTGAFGLAHQYGTASESDGYGNSVSVSASSNAFYAAVGGGVRLYVGKRWGLKPEVRYERFQNTQGGNNTVMYTVGVFYRFGE